MSNKNQKQHYNILRSLTFASQIGITMLACILIGVFLGNFLDKRLGTSPWLLILFLLLGIIAAFRSVISMAKRK